MKIVPSNQTLILANERARPGSPDTPTLHAALSPSSGDTILQRVTIVTAHPDATMVYVQADYAAAESPPLHRFAQPASQDSGTPFDERTFEEVDPPSLPAPIVAPRSPGFLYGRGIALYASTQRLESSTGPTARLNVHA